MDAVPTHDVVRTWPLRHFARFSNAALSLFDQGIVSVANFLTIVLLARALPIEAFGVFMVANTVLLLLTGLQNALVSQPHNILGAQRSGHRYATLTTTLGALQLVTCVAFMLIAAAAGFLWSASGADSYARTAYALALIIPAWMSQEFVRRVLYTEGDIAGAALNNFISYGLQVAGIVGVYFVADLVDPQPAFALYVLGGSSLVACLFGIALRCRRATRLKRGELFARQSRSEFAATAKETWRMSKWLVAQQGASWLGTSGQGLLLTAFLGPAAFGVYRAAYQVVNLLNPLRQAATNHLPSRAARIRAAEGRRGLSQWNSRMTYLLAIPFAVVALGIVFFAQPIAKLMYGTTDNLTHLELIVGLGALAYMLNFARTPLDYSVLVSGGARALFVRTLWLNAFVLTVGLLLIRQLGVIGVLISEVSVAALAALLTIKVAASLLKPPENDTSTALVENEEPR